VLSLYAAAAAADDDDVMWTDRTLSAASRMTTHQHLTYTPSSSSPSRCFCHLRHFTRVSAVWLLLMEASGSHYAPLHHLCPALPAVAASPPTSLLHCQYHFQRFISTSFSIYCYSWLRSIML